MKIYIDFIVFHKQFFLLKLSFLIANSNKDINNSDVLNYYKEILKRKLINDV